MEVGYRTSGVADWGHGSHFQKCRLEGVLNCQSISLFSPPGRRLPIQFHVFCHYEKVYYCDSGGVLCGGTGEWDTVAVVIRSLYNQIESCVHWVVPGPVCDIY